MVEHAEERGRGRWRRRRRILRGAALLLALVGLIGLIGIDRGVVRRFEARTSTLSSRVFSAPLRMERGERLDPAALLAQLQRLGYLEVEQSPVDEGEFRRDGSDWEIHLRAANTPAGPRPARRLELGVTRGKLRRIRDLSGDERPDGFSLEPEPLLTFFSEVQEDRRWTALGEIPIALREAVEAVEDRRFRRHHGVDLVGIGRAMLANVRAGGVVQGGSTVTQQLAKNLYGPGRRSLRRKALEAVAAVALELHYSKDAILEAYLNEVYLGQTGPVAVSGVGAASRFHFGVDVGGLDLPRCALLAGMIRNPGGYNPRADPERARGRRDLVLELMARHGFIDEAEQRAAAGTALDPPVQVDRASRYPWIEDYLAAEVRKIVPEAIPAHSGFSMYVTFDPDAQHAARAALDSGLARLEQRLGTRGEPVEGAVIVMRPADGALLALVGGRDFGRSQFNRATRSRRSPGSTFKPFVFLAGFERAEREPGFEFTAATLLEDTPLELRAGGKPWTPGNYDGRFRGPISARQALENSVNVATVRAALAIGLPEIVETARRCGIESPLESIPSLALGTKEVTPLELAGAYATLANGGRRVVPHGLAGLTDRHGAPLARSVDPPTRVVSSEAAFLVTDLLSGVIERGTARSAAGLGLRGHAAGKTGSSEGLRDGWFVGYTPDLLALVWVGYDDNRPLGLPGGATALPIWVDLLRRLDAAEAPAFDAPDGIVRLDVDPATGERAARGCPAVVSEYFIAGTEPEEPCHVHGGKRRGFWKRMFSRKG